MVIMINTIYFFLEKQSHKGGIMIPKKTAIKRNIIKKFNKSDPQKVGILITKTISNLSKLCNKGLQ